jgi:Uma2 family endonuclease
MSLPQAKLYTIEDIYDLPEGSRAELIDGQIYYMAPPSMIHQRISSFLHGCIARYITDNHGTCEIFAAPFAVFLNQDSINYVEPDISVICDPSKITPRGCSGAPDWVIEIVSPSSKNMDYFTKLFKYRNSGVHEYWIVDPIKRNISVYNFDKEEMNSYTFSDSVPVGIYGDLYIDFSNILLS